MPPAIFRTADVDSELERHQSSSLASELRGRGEGMRPAALGLDVESTRVWRSDRCERPQRESLDGKHGCPSCPLDVVPGGEVDRWGLGAAVA